MYEVEFVGGVEKGAQTVEPISPGDVTRQSRGVRVTVLGVEVHQEVIGEDFLRVGEGEKGEEWKQEEGGGEEERGE